MASLKIGVLAIQGDFLEHCFRLKQAASKLAKLAKVDIFEVRTKEQLQNLDGLIVPGGESTTLSYFFEKYDLLDTLRQMVAAENKPVIWGTCAGLIVLSNRVLDAANNQKTIGGINIEARRNHYGSQVQSFQAPVTLSGHVVQALGGNSKNSQETVFPGVFIRAPQVVSLLSPSVRPLVTMQSVENHEIVVGVEEGKLMATAFHPELTNDVRLHEYFLLRCLASL